MDDKDKIIEKLVEAMRPLIPNDNVEGKSGSDILAHYVKVRDIRNARRAIKDAEKDKGE